ncbi:MAG: hypothetical protein AB1758_05280 [Candidatus Eremiobacterota bacterium]
MKSRGYTLLDALLVLLIASSLLVGLLLAVRPARSRSHSRALAQRVAAELVRLRQQAISSGSLVAMVLPTANGSRPHAQGVYLAAGEGLLNIQRTLDFSREYPSTVLVHGHWALRSGSFSPPTVALTTREGSLNLDTLRPDPSDRLLVFLPSGEAAADLPEVDGAYALVVCQGVTCAPDPLGGAVPSWRLLGVQDGYTVSVGRLGDVSVASGVSGAAPGVEGLLTGPAQTPAGVGPRSRGPNLDPVIQGTVAVYPTPVPVTLPPGIDATVRQQGHLVLEVTARDPDGDPLSCEWISRDGGGLSAATPGTMRWQADRNGWVGRWEFHPDPKAPPSTVYRLACTVRDPRGGEATATIGAAGRVEVLDAQSISFQDGADQSMYVVNRDGTEPTCLFRGSPAARFSTGVWSPDASRMCFISTRDWEPVPPGVTHAGDLYIAYPDGSGLRKLIDPRDYGYDGLIGAAWRSDGSRVLAALRRTSGEVDLVLINADGTHPDDPALTGGRVIDLPPGLGFGPTSSLSIHPVKERLVFHRGTWTPPTELMEFDLDTGVLSVLTPTAGYDREPNFSPDGTQIVFTRDFQIAYAPYDPEAAPGSRVGAVQQVPGDTYDNSACFSPDGRTLVFDSYRTGTKELFTFSLDSGEVRQLTNNTPYVEDDPNWSR